MATASKYIKKDLYKALNVSNQNKRREQLLAEQKKLRDKVLDASRNLYPEEDVKTPKRYTKNVYIKKYKDLVMLSEWLVEVAPDFDVSWYMKASPEGFRNVVVAQKQCTTAYTRFGKLLSKFESSLPGGSKCTDPSDKNKTTILDCIVNEKTKTFYVLDVLIWNNFDLRDCNAEFRFFWLKSKLEELPDMRITSSKDYTGFKYVTHTSCDIEQMKEILSNFPFYESNTPSVDGFLFYHKEASYTAGNTPLVGWLKPYMIAERLNIPVASEYLRMRPKKYKSLEEHIKYVEQDKMRRVLHRNGALNKYGELSEDKNAMEGLEEMGAHSVKPMKKLRKGQRKGPAQVEMDVDQK